MVRILPKDLIDAVARIEAGAPDGARDGDRRTPPVSLFEDLLLARGVVHEWIGAESEVFAPPLLLLAELAGRAVAPVGDPGRRWLLFLGRDCWPYPKRLLDLEDGADRLGRSLFVELPPGARRARRRPSSPRTKRGEGDPRIWALDLACRCPSVAAVVADGRGLGMAATRRLQIAAAEGGGLVLLARTPRERGVLSAAATRWGVGTVPTEREQPRFRITLERCKGAPPHPEMRPGRSWVWDTAAASGATEGVEADERGDRDDGGERDEGAAAAVAVSA